MLAFSEQFNYFNLRKYVKHNCVFVDWKYGNGKPAFDFSPDSIWYGLL